MRACKVYLRCWLEIGSKRAATSGELGQYSVQFDDVSCLKPCTSKHATPQLRDTALHLPKQLIPSLQQWRQPFSSKRTLSHNNTPYCWKVKIQQWKSYTHTALMDNVGCNALHTVKSGLTPATHKKQMRRLYALQLIPVGAELRLPAIAFISWSNSANKKKLRHSSRFD